MDPDKIFNVIAVLLVLAGAWAMWPRPKKTRADRGKAAKEKDSA